MKVFKSGVEFRHLADVEYQLLRRLENSTKSETDNLKDECASPVIRAYSITGSDLSVTLTASEVLSGNGVHVSLSHKGINTPS